MGKLENQKVRKSENEKIRKLENGEIVGFVWTLQLCFRPQTELCSSVESMLTSWLECCPDLSIILAGF